MEFFAAFIFLCFLHLVGCSLFCGKCDNVTDIALCQDVVICHTSQACYTERIDYLHGPSSFSLGCMDTSNCVFDAPAAFGRSLHKKASPYSFGRSLRASGGCHNCCKGTLCNVNLCQVQQIPVTTSVPSTATTPHVTCTDSGSRCNEDPDVKQLVCSVDPHLCKKTCGLCTAANEVPIGACFDRGTRCTEDKDVKNLVCAVDPHLCAKTCGICS